MEDFLTLVLFSGTEKQDLLRKLHVSKFTEKTLRGRSQQFWRGLRGHEGIDFFPSPPYYPTECSPFLKEEMLANHCHLTSTETNGANMDIFYNVHNHNHKHHPFMSPSHDNCPPLRHLPVAEIHAVLGRLHVGCKHDTLPASWHPIQPTSRGFWWKV